ncbi:MAG: DUF5908 family protein [Leptothrix sp. (in: b-proteobacteria)]
MTIEVRQLVIRAQVGQRSAPPLEQDPLAARDLERLRADILRECKAWLREQLNAARER